MKVTKHGNHYATAEHAFRCHECGCEFLVEVGDLYWQTDIHDKAGKRIGRDQSERWQYTETTRCPECGDSVLQLRRDKHPEQEVERNG